MSADKKQQEQAIYDRINKITDVTSLSELQAFNHYSSEEIEALLRGMTAEDRLYLFWVWGKNDAFVGNEKWHHQILKFPEVMQELVEAIHHHPQFARNYIKKQSQILQDAALELMHLNGDYQNPDLQGSVDLSDQILDHE